VAEAQRLPAYGRESAAVRLPGAVSLEDLSPEWAWGGATGKGVRVAVIDSGIEANHPALHGCVDQESGVALSLSADGNVEITEGPNDDLFGHGTACAGIIHSIAPDARITSVRVLGQMLTGKSQVFIAGLSWAIERGFDVINLSLGSSKRDWALAFYELCDAAYFRGCFIVTAANNLPLPSYPSMYASVASVASNLATDPLRYHYNPEPPTEFLARGVDVEVAWKGEGWMVSTGNSYAAPHIAGIAALIKSKHPDLRPFQLKTVLWAAAANVREAPRPAGRLSQAIRRSRSTAAANLNLSMGRLGGQT
jgi:subtilisin family serine protease